MYQIATKQAVKSKDRQSEIWVVKKEDFLKQCYLTTQTLAAVESVLQLGKKKDLYQLKNVVQLLLEV